ncbi:MAG: amidohydrolase family protein [Acidobacteria bacterium]|nr:amidohydrolase family protein [Acidobacteriota bacterium]MBI3658015.1 amidohydrolase family protein [Acidobacteriota bacterium]
MMQRGFRRRCLLLLALAAGGLLLTSTVQAERPRVYALTNAKIITAPGKTIEKGIIVLRDGLIEAVGAQATIPADAVEIDGSGKTVYPGLIDGYSHMGLRPAPTAPEASAETRRPGRTGLASPLGLAPRPESPAGAIHPLSGVRPETQARNLIVPFEGENNDAERYRRVGITTVLTVPDSGIFRGESALINLKDGVATSGVILKGAVAQHVAFQYGGFRGSYPTSLMGAAAAFRQVLLDADRYLIWKKRYAANPTGMKRPEYSSAFEALAPVLDRQRPIIFEVDRTQDALLADRLAREFDLRAIIAGSGNEWELLDPLKTTGRTLILPVALPEKPKVEDADEALDIDTRELQRYVHAPENPKRLYEAGVRFILSTRGLKNPADFPKNMRKIIEAGLPANVALAALTTVPAEVFGVSSMLGTLEPGKIANLIVTDGELFAEKTKVKQIFVDGHEYKIDEKEKPKGDPTAVVDPRGTWSVAMEFPGGRSMNSTWIIEGTKGSYSGTSESPRGTTEFTNIQLEGNALTVTLPGRGGQGRFEITVIITGDSLEGTAEQGRMTVKVSGTRTAGPVGGAL